MSSPSDPPPLPSGSSWGAAADKVFDDDVLEFEVDLEEEVSLSASDAIWPLSPDESRRPEVRPIPPSGSAARPVEPISLSDSAIMEVVESDVRPVSAPAPVPVQRPVRSEQRGAEQPAGSRYAVATPGSSRVVVKRPNVVIRRKD